MDVGPSARRQGVLGLSGKASMYGDQAVGSSVGILVVSYLLTRNNQVNHATVASHVTAFNHVFDNSTVRKALSPWTASRRAALDQVIQTQASIISYIDDFKLMMILSLAAIPLVLLPRSAPTSGESDHAMVTE
jgi:DHA2 family multidrug resistance protein